MYTYSIRSLERDSMNIVLPDLFSSQQHAISSVANTPHFSLTLSIPERQKQKFAKYICKNTFFLYNVSAFALIAQIGRALGRGPRSVVGSSPAEGTRKI